MPNRPIAALIYDFDNTLSPKNMQEYSFIPELGMSPEEFWAECRQAQLAYGMDSVLAYMMMMKTRSERAGMRLTRERLESMGSAVEFFPGVETWFSRINATGESLGINVEHYIISSGLKEIIAGSRIAGEFKAVFAAGYVYGEDGSAVWPATSVNYTEKTQHLFRINKGILDMTNDRDLNGFTPEYKRRVPFSNMIYIGDGLTDVPCMKLVKTGGGHSVAAYQLEGGEADRLIIQGRAGHIAPADYRENTQMDKTIKAILDLIAASSKTTEMYVSDLEAAKNRS